MQALKKTYIIFFAIMLIGTTGLIVLSARYNTLFTRASQWVDHSLQVLETAQRARVDLPEMALPEGQQSGLRTEISALREMTADNPLQHARVDSLAPYVAGRNEGAVRALLLRIQTEEFRLLELRQAENSRTGKLLREIIGTLLVLIISLLCAAIFLLLYNLRRRTTAEKGLQESRESFDLLVRNIKDYAIFKIDLNGRVMSWNQGAEQIKGYRQEEAIGRPIDIFYPEEERQRGDPEANLRKAMEDGRYECIGRRLRKDGSIFWADVVFTAMWDQEGELTGFIKITRDITTELKARGEMELALAKEKALNEMKSKFVSLASHEFKTPLSVILSSTSLLEKYSAPEMEDQRKRHFQRIKSNVNNLKQLLNDFLSLEKLEEGIIRNNPVEIDLVQLTEDSIQDMEEFSRDHRSILLEVEGTPRPVMVDPHLLPNILNNLLSNAIKYSPPDCPIRLTVVFESDTLRLSVADEGIGIPVEEQGHLFERFFRARNAASISGTGLGLNIVRRYLDLMGGHIAIQSEAGKGSVFTVTLPG